MKFSREYLLGLGSGLILSALLLLIFPPAFTNTLADKNSSDAAASKATAVKENPPDQTSESSAQTTANAQEKTSSENAAQVKKNIVISPGTSADKIAQLLQTEGLIQKKEDFMAFVKAKKLESRFKAGSYELQTGLSLEDLVNQLIR
ncbi:endolytic transglycosylase MltG [Desulfitobacterium sp. Sab5]|uniref:endolytic transglycosylase MltG n=1 Tax=Desulfitobacterium nosdiversum TaxID=3375356 RepID=UPI003CEDD447